MTTQRIIYYPVPFIVLHPNIPIAINTVLPSHITQVTGIKVVHSAGIERMTTETYMPVIGHLSLEFNNKRYHLGNMDVTFDHNADASDAYLDVDIEIFKNALLTGNYENKVFNSSNFIAPNGTTTNKWSNYIITIYLKAYSND